MASSLKVLGQSAPLAAALTDLYTVPGATQTTVSTLYVSNHNATTIKFRVSVAIAGAVDDPKQYLYFDTLITANATFAATVGLALSATDKIRVQSDTLNVSFSAFGLEES